MKGVKKEDTDAFTESTNPLSFVETIVLVSFNQTNCLPIGLILLPDEVYNLDPPILLQ